MRKNYGNKGMIRGMLCLMAVAVALVSLCLGGCSGEVLDDGKGTLTIVEGSGNFLELPTESSTGSSISITTPTDPFADAAHILRVDFLNTGDSDCILLRMDDTVILVDTGESDDYHKISTKLNDCGIQTIDYLIISHFDNDHIGTAAQILQNYQVNTVYMPDYVRDSNLYRRMVSTWEVLENTTVHRLTEDAHIELDYGSLWINPTHLYGTGITMGSDNAGTVEENNFSLITSVYFGDISLLLAGDAEQERMEEFGNLFTEETIAYDVVKIPHHGGYDKAVGDFLRATKDELRYCVVCVGEQSSVDASLVTGMRTAGAGAYYTCNGDISFATDGTSMVLTQE